MPTKKEQAAQSRQRLIDAAKELMSQKDYDQIKITDITAAAGLSAGSFYHYFQTKSDIIYAVEREPTLKIIDDLKHTEGLSIRECLRQYILRWTEMVVHEYGPYFSRQWFICHLRGENSPDRIDVMIEEVKVYLQEGKLRGELAPELSVQEVAQHIVFELYGANLCYTMTAGKFPLLDWTEGYCDMVDRLLLPPGSRPPQA